MLTRITALSLLLISLFLFAVPASAGAGAGKPVTITTGTPRKEGTVTIKIYCKRSGGAEVQVTNVRVWIDDDDSAEKKAQRIKDAVDKRAQDCYSSAIAGNKVTLTPKSDDLEITRIEHDLDKTNELFGVTPDGVGSSLVRGNVSLYGDPVGGSVSLELPGYEAAFVDTLVDMTIADALAALAQQLLDQGAPVVAGESVLRFYDIDNSQTIWVDVSDPGLAVGLDVRAQDITFDTLELNGRRLVAINDGAIVRFQLLDGSQVGATVATNGRAVVVTVGSRIVVIDDLSVRLYDARGVQVGATIATSGPANLHDDGNCIVIADNSSVRIFDQNGVQQGATIATDGRAHVEINGDRIVVIDRSSVRLFNKNGAQVGATITTASDGGRALVDFRADRIVVIDNDGVRIFDRNGVQQGATIATDGGMPLVYYGDNCIIIVDGASVRIFDNNGVQQGGTILTDGRADIVLHGGRIIVIDDSSVRVYDKSGVQQGTTIATTGRAGVQVRGDRIVVIDDDSVRIYDKNGVQQGATIGTTGRAEILFHGHCIIVIDDDAVRIYDKHGVQQGATIATSGRADVFGVGDRMIVIDDDSVRIFNKNGVQQGATIATSGRARVEAIGDRLIVIDDDSVRIYDRNGVQQGATIATTGFVHVEFGADGCIIVVDDNSVRIYDKNGIQQGATIATNGQAHVVVDGDRIIVIDDDSVRIYDKSGVQQGAAIATSGRADAFVNPATGCIIVVDDNSVRIFDRAGVQKGTTVNTLGRSEVVPLGTTLLIIDAQQVQIADEYGNTVGAPAFGAGRPDATLLLPPQPPLPQLDLQGMLMLPHGFEGATYHFWRLPDPLQPPGAPDAALLQTLTPQSEQLGEPLLVQDFLIDSFFDVCYRIEIELPDETPPLLSMPVCKGTVMLEPGYNLVTPKLFNNDMSPQTVLGSSLHGTGDPLTSDRILIWDAVSQHYVSAWLCGGAECQTFGEEWYNRWLTENYAPTELQLSTFSGFWYVNRSGDTELWQMTGWPQLPATIAPPGLPIMPPSPGLVIEPGWSLFGNSLPLPPLPLEGLQLADPYGTGDPLTADGITLWQPESQSWRSAWFCAGAVCEEFGDLMYRRWLNSDYSQSDALLDYGQGFWYDHRGLGFIPYPRIDPVP